MRLLALFLAIYFAVLGCLPCADEALCAEPAHAAAMRAAHSDCGATHGGLDWCSPLCQCQCCGGFALPLGGPVALVPPPRTPAAAPRYAQRPVPAVLGRTLGSPWQPPRWA